jgi:hypothetical protein
MNIKSWPSRLPGKDTEIESNPVEEKREEALYMHGQKKRRKRSLEAWISVDGAKLYWRLVSEPQWTTEHGFKGLCFSVQLEEGHHRELILEYPFERGSGLTPKFPQRPKFSAKDIEAGIRQAIAAAWEPASRGKKFIFRLAPIIR